MLSVDFGGGGGEGGFGVMVSLSLAGVGGVGVAVDFGGRGAERSVVGVRGECVAGSLWLRGWRRAVESGGIGGVLGGGFTVLRRWVLGRRRLLLLLRNRVVRAALDRFRVDLFLLDRRRLRALGKCCAGGSLGLGDTHASAATEAEEED